MSSVLICDDEKDIRTALSIYLSGEGYTILTAENGAEALDILRREAVSLVLLDVMMPKMDGIETLSELRKFSNIPVLLLTAKSEEADKVLGLGLGADDYITKPFSAVEVIARVKSHLRRWEKLGGEPHAAEETVLGGIVLNDRAKAVTVDGEAVKLTPIEYGILRLLMQSPGRVCSTSEIYEAVWQEKAFGGENAVAVHIRHLREKIEIDPADPRYLKVVWGQGYKMEEETK